MSFDQGMRLADLKLQKANDRLSSFFLRHSQEGGPRASSVVSRTPKYKDALFKLVEVRTSSCAYT